MSDELRSTEGRNPHSQNPFESIREHGLTRHSMIRAFISDRRRDPVHWRPVHFPADEAGVVC